MSQSEAAARLARAALNKVDKLFSEERTWALQEVLRAYCRHGCPDDMTKEVTTIIAQMSKQTPLVEVIDKLEAWAERRLDAASS